MCIYIHIIIYTEHTHILCKQKLLFWMRLIEINRLTALYTHTHTHTHTHPHTHTHTHTHTYIYMINIVLYFRSIVMFLRIYISSRTEGQRGLLKSNCMCSPYVHQSRIEADDDSCPRLSSFVLARYCRS